MPVETTFRLRNDFGDLSAVAEATTNFLEENAAGPEVVFAANLAIEELVTNIIKYGYDDEASHEITVHLATSADVLEIRICDDGHEFNPFDQPEPDTTLPAEERDIGGLGIHFVRNMLDSCAYVRQDGRNIVTITKKL
ncbi:MAG: ATP-binding protein [Terrimicrobiaceae bacterium]